MSLFRAPQLRRGLVAMAAATSALLLAATGNASAAAHAQQQAPQHAPRQFDWSALATPGNGPAQHTAGSQIRKHFVHALSADKPVHTQGTLSGIDVSNYQGNVDWAGAAGGGVRFAYIKATEGHDYTSPSFSGQYDGSYGAGVVRGAYHFAIPNDGTTATQQADFFVEHGGGWTADGKTLPPMLDIEYNPYGATCYGLDQASMQAWIGEFSNEVHNRTGRFPTVYTNLDWWSQCTGNWNGLAATNPLFVARYGTSDPGELPGGWANWTIWQYADSGAFPGDQDYFNGDDAALLNFANGT